MGSSESKYFHTTQDLVERCVKKNFSLEDTLSYSGLSDASELLQLIFIPNNWNIIHLCCWYGNKTLLAELLNDRISSEILNAPDSNKEPPVVLCCAFNDENLLSLMIELGRCLTIFNGETRYRENLCLSRVCIEHDSKECFIILNPDIYANDNKLEELYDLAIELKSEKILGLWDNDDSTAIFEDTEFNMVKENQPESIKA